MNNGDKIPVTPSKKIKGTYKGRRKHEPASDENLGPLVKWLSLLGLAYFAVPLLLIGGVLIGAGILAGYLIWGH